MIIRWIPLISILLVSFLILIYITNTITDFNKRKLPLISLIYLTFLGMILFTPVSFTGTAVYIMPTGIGQVNLHHIYYDLGFIENIILTVPLGFLIKKAFSEISVISMIPLGVIIGASIETMQYYLSHTFLINRTSDISDVVANAAGIVIGATVMLFYQYVVEKKPLDKLSVR